MAEKRQAVREIVNTPFYIYQNPPILHSDVTAVDSADLYTVSQCHNRVIRSSTH